MWKKILLTIPALLVGPAVVLIVFVLGYDWSVTGAAMTALISSGSAVAAVWRRKKEPAEIDSNNRTNKLIRVGIWSSAVIIAIIVTYLSTVERPTENATLLVQAGEGILNATQCEPQYDAPSALDRPFIVVEERHLESFPVELETAIKALPPGEQQSISDAISFLTFAIGTHISEEDPDYFEKLSDSDIMAKFFVRMYRFGQNRGSCMTLRKYIDLAQELKRQKPEWWGQYRSFSEGPPQ